MRAGRLDLTFVRAICAARETEVGVEPAAGFLAPVLRTEMTRPQPRAFIAGKASRVSRI